MIFRTVIKKVGRYWPCWQKDSEIVLKNYRTQVCTVSVLNGRKILYYFFNGAYPASLGSILVSPSPPLRRDRK